MTKRWMRQPMSWRRGGAVALVVLVVLAGAALVLDMDAGGEYVPVIERLEERGTEPGRLVEELGRASRIVVLGDVRDRAAPKRIAAESIRRLTAGPGLDAVALEVPASEQPYIDAFLAAEEADAAALLSRPGAVQERYGLSRDFLGIYEAVREVNEGLPASRRVRIIAMDVETWPPEEGLGPREIGELYAGRAETMLAQLDRQLFSIMPDARVLVFVDGYMALQGTHGELGFGGGEPLRVEWLGQLLRRRSGADAVTVLVDPGSSMAGVQRMPAYQGTVLHRPLRRELGETTAARVAGALAEVQDPVIELSTTGLTLEVEPEGYAFGRAAQGYVFLPGGR